MPKNNVQQKTTESSEFERASQRNASKNQLHSTLGRQAQRVLRNGVVVLGYLFFFAMAFWMAFAFRYDFDLSHKGFAACYENILWVVIVKTAVFFWHRHFHSYWFFATFRDFQVLAKSALISSFTIYILGHYLFNLYLPRTVPVLDCIFTVLLVGVARFGWRTLRQEIIPRITRKDYRKTLIIGANPQGASLAHELCDHPELGLRIVGFCTVHRRKVGKQLGHIPVLCHLSDLESAIVSYGIKEVLTLPGALKGEQIRTAMNRCRERGIRLRIVPSIETRIGSTSIPIRDIRIEDILKRDPITLDDTIIKEVLTGKTVLVTGAGGSIGSEICRQLISFRPKKLIILGRGENRIFYIEQELSNLGFEGELVPIIADVTKESRMDGIFQEHRPEVIFHAAAHKHVPLMEQNVSEAVVNNVLGTKITADLAHKYQAETFVLISTDKAVNPTSVMGATKHMAERYVHSYSSRSRTKFMVTRFGNVLGSNGSVVPLFRKQIAQGGPVTVTDFRMTRYFMTIPEASQLVLQAAGMGIGGEIFVLDMGDPVRIKDLAQDLIRLSGLPEKSIEICEIGMRPGEKLYEELYFDSEKAIRTSHPKLRCATHRHFELKQVEEQIQTLLQMVGNHSEVIRMLLQEIVEEYRPFNGHDPDRPKISIYAEDDDVRKAG